MTLTEFLLARIEEDGAAAGGVSRGLWNSRVALLDPDLYGLVSRQHPARVLAECEAKRRIVEQVQREEGLPDLGDPADGAVWVALDQVLRALALPYADHPDYDEEWQP